MTDKVFNVKFVDWGEEIEENKCDFCEAKGTRYYCDFLVTGYCEKCMKEQLEELQVKKQ